MLIVGPKSTSTGTNDNSVGTALWANAGQTVSSDNLYANRVATGDPETTQYLKLTNFGITFQEIPAHAYIRGIEVQVERKKQSGTGNVTDNSVKLVRGGVVLGDEKAKSGNWPTSDTSVTYGGMDDTWGVRLDGRAVVDSGFGVAISTTSSGGTASYGVDYVGITVFFEICDSSATI